jgi:hypothetical protein
VNGYLLFDTVTPETRSALFEMVEDELLRLATVTVSGSVAGFAAYSAPDLRAAYALIEAVTDVVGLPSARLVAVSGQRAGMPPDAPGTVAFASERVVALVLLRVPLSRAEEVAELASRTSRGRAAVVVGGPVTVVVEVDGASAEELEARLADVLAIAGGDSADILLTTSELGAGWGGSIDEHRGL